MVFIYPFIIDTRSPFVHTHSKRNLSSQPSLYTLKIQQILSSSFHDRHSPPHNLYSLCDWL
jgi:hypothetical protein